MNYFIVSLICSTALLVSTHAAACSPPPPNPSYLLVGNKGENTVSFIDLENGIEIGRKSVSATAPHEIAVSKNGRFAAVVNYGDAVIDIFDVGSRYIITSIDLEENNRPHGLVALKSGGFVATTEGSNTIVLLSPNHDFSQTGSGQCPKYDWTVESIPTGQDGTHMIALSPDDKTAYTANMQSATVSRIDLATKTVKSVPAGKEVEGIAVTKDGKEVWASIRGEDKVAVFDAATLEQLAEIPVGGFPLRIVASPDGKVMATSNLMDGSISVIDISARQVQRTLKVSGTKDSAQVTLLFSKNGRTLYAAETGTNTVAEIEFSSGKILRRFGVGIQGDGLAIVPASP